MYFNIFFLFHIFLDLITIISTYVFNIFLNSEAGSEILENRRRNLYSVLHIQQRMQQV